MDVPKIRVDGIYDLDTLKLLHERRINFFGFDFRPLSFNFLQQHVFFEMLDELINSNHIYYLRYANEPAFATEKMLTDLREKFGEKSVAKYFMLEFSDDRDSEFYDQFNQPFYWHYTNFQELEKILLSNNLVGIILDHHILDNLHLSGTLFDFMRKFYQRIGDKPVILNIKWDSSIITSLFDFFKFESVTISIDSSVENSYRNINQSALTVNLNYLQSKIYNMVNSSLPKTTAPTLMVQN